MKKKAIKKLIKRQKEHLKFKKGLTNDNDIKNKLDIELKEIEKLGMNAFGCPCLLFSVGDIVGITYEVGDKERTLEGRILLYESDCIILYIEKEERLIRISRMSVVLIEMIDIPEDHMYNYINNDYENSMKKHHEDGEEIG